LGLAADRSKNGSVFPSDGAPRRHVSPPVFLQGLEATRTRRRNCSSFAASQRSSNTLTRGELTKSLPLRKSEWSSMPKSPSPVLSRSWPLSARYTLASRIPHTVCSISTRPMSSSADGLSRERPSRKQGHASRRRRFIAASCSPSPNRLPYASSLRSVLQRPSRRQARTLSTRLQGAITATRAAAHSARGQISAPARL